MKERGQEENEYRQGVKPENIFMSPEPQLSFHASSIKWDSRWDLVSLLTLWCEHIT